MSREPYHDESAMLSSNGWMNSESGADAPRLRALTCVRAARFGIVPGNIFDHVWVGDHRLDGRDKFPIALLALEARVKLCEPIKQADRIIAP